ncbi:MAG: ATP-dependent helicase [Nanoarchaeota archaeon]|nr:ATP-dependent helicase [Nanoarchaeota archaeon]
MITIKDKPNTEAELRNVLNPLVQKWFFTRFKEFSLPQLFGVMEVHSRSNILISAPTGSTKCLTPDETVLITENGIAKLVSGHELIEKAKAGKLLKKVDKTGELFEVSGLSSFSFDEANTIKQAKALVYSEKTRDKLLKIKTEYGREVKISREHPLLVEGKGWVKAKDLMAGDKIAAPKKIILPEQEIQLEWEKAISSVKAKAEICLTYNDFLRLKEKTKRFKHFSGINPKETKELLLLAGLSYSAVMKETGLSLSQIYRIVHCKTKYGKAAFELLLNDKLSGLSFEKNRVIYKTYGTHSFSFTYPKILDIKLARWLAFVLAEGLIGDYEKGTYLAVSQKSQMGLLNEFLQMSKEYFNISFVKKNERDYVVYSTLFCYFLNELFSFNRGRGRYVEFPQWLLNCKREIKNNFLNVFFALEATFTNTGIKISQANKQKIEVINYLLLSNGIFSSIGKEMGCATNTAEKIKREYYTLTIRQVSNLNGFIDVIGIEHRHKSRIINHIKSKPSGNYVNKFTFDYKKIRALSRHYKNDEHFRKDIGQIYEVVRRTGFITYTALSNLANKLKHKWPSEPLLKEVDELLSLPILWLKVKSITSFDYEGNVFDLTVPNIHNFVGGFGGIILHNTLTAFLSVLNELVDSAQKGILQDKVYCIYISPLRALSRDIERNLLEPLKEMEKLAGKDLGIRVGVRTSDTTQAEKAKMLKKPPHILITTPESLAILLSTIKFKECMRNIDWCIIDEVHALAENKRGVHLSISMERLNLLSISMARVGLSATIAPLEEIAKYLVGIGRNCKLIDVQFVKKLNLDVLSPADDLINTSYDTLNNNLYKMIDAFIQAHKTSLIFTNTRSGTERVVHHLKAKFPGNYYEIHEGPPKTVASLIGAHHGSLSREHRFQIEDSLREGKLKAVVSSTSLELGIDIGYIDLVLCLGSPKSVARFLQRAGRAGHKMHETVNGRLIVMDRDDLIECSVLLKYAKEKKIDRVSIPTNCGDVLGQQIIGIALESQWNVKELYEMIKKSYCYQSLEWKDYDEILSYLAGEYAALEDRHVYAKIWYDRETGMIGRKGKATRVIYMTNIGTIPDSSGVTVKIGNQRIGTIDEGFLEKLKPGDRFVLGGNVYQFKFARGTVAQVMSASGQKPTIPSWFSESLPLSFDLAMGIQKFRKNVSDRLKRKDKKENIVDFIKSNLYVGDITAWAIYNYLNEQHRYVGIPHKTEILVEHYKDGNNRFDVFHTLYGRRVNDVLSRVVAYAVRRLYHIDVDIRISDNGFVLSSSKGFDAMKAFKLLKSNEIRKVAKYAIEQSEALKRKFRHCAGRAMMILREYKGHRKHVGRQQTASMILLAAVRRISEDFVILKEARREVLEDQMDIASAELILKAVEEEKIKVREVQTDVPSPFAFNLVAQGYSDIMKMEDKAEFLKRMHQMVLAKVSLKQGKEKKL